MTAPASLPVREIETAWIPMPDGCRLAARVWLPADAEARPVPAILEYIPYRRRDFSRGRDEAMHGWFAGHGYAAVRVDLRGSGDSDGLLLDEYLPRELADGLEVIRWIADQPWCTGAVGMIGISWGGFSALQLAALRPPALKAIITVCSTDDRYADDVHYMGGAMLVDNLVWGAVMLSFNAYPPDPAVVGPRWREMWRRRIEGAPAFSEAWLAHPHRDAYWRHGSVGEDLGRIACPVYAVGGWADGYSNAVPRLLAGLSAPAKGLIGPWAHVYPHDGLPGPAIGFISEALRWWDCWLKGLDTGIMAEPAYRAWMQDSVAPRDHYATRPGRWVAESGWPSSRIVPRRLAVNADGLAEAAAAPADLVLPPCQTVGLAAGDWCPYGGPGSLPGDQRADDAGSLVFDTAPLAERLEILGAPEAVLEISVDRANAIVALRLEDVAPDGAATRVSFGLLNLAHRDGHARPAAAVPGRRYRLRLRLNDVAHAFAPGRRLRLAVSTAYWPIAWPAPEPVTLTLHTGASILDLPVRPPDEADARLPAFGPPERAPVSAAGELRAKPPMRSVSRDPATGETVYREESSPGPEEAPAFVPVEPTGLEVGYAIREEFRIRADDPLSATAEVVQRTVFRRGDWRVRVDTRARLEATSDKFLFSARADAFEGEEPFAARRWSAEYPRKLV